MKRFLFLSFFAALTFATAASAQTTPKIAVVDLKKVFDGYYKTKDAAARMKEIGTSFQKEMQDMMADYQKMVDEATKLKTASEDKTLSKDAQDQKRKVFEVKVQDIKNMERKMREFEITRRKQLDDQQVRMIGAIRDEITKVVKDTSSRKGYNLVFDLSGVSLNGANTIVYASGMEDFTDDVLRQVNAGQPAGGAASTAPVTPKPVAKP